MQIYNESFYPIDARMYLVLEDNEAFIVDPCESEKALELLRVNQIEKLHVFLTHEHYDHISGVNWLRDNFENVTVYCLDKCAKAIPNPSKNLSLFYKVLFMGKSPEEQEYVENMDVLPFSCEADITFEKEFDWEWKGHSVHCVATPGHSPGSICIFFDDILFSGDTLVTGNDTITRLPGGSKKEFKEITLPLLREIPETCMVYPGHGEKQNIKQYPVVQK